MSTTCTFRSGGGSGCSRPAGKHGTFCQWHDPEDPRDDPALADQLVQLAQKGESLEGFQLAGARLDGIRLARANLRHANLADARLVDAELADCDLSQGPT